MDNMGLQLVAKVGAVLDALAEHGPLTPAELASVTGEPRSSLYRIVESLQSLELVEPAERRGAVQLGLHLFRLGSIVAQRFDVRQRALPPMEELHRASGETVVLMVPRGREAVCLERLDGRYVRMVIVEIGGAMPLHTGAAPRALLAYRSPGEIEAYLEQPALRAYTERTAVDPAAIRTLLDETRDRGYSTSDEDVVAGVAAIAAPVRDSTGAVVAAISLTGARPTILGEREEVVAGLVRAAAGATSLALGWSGQDAANFTGTSHTV
jgi:DNA-binding IclR family transcriptional regulator